MSPAHSQRPQRIQTQTQTDAGAHHTTQLQLQELPEELTPVAYLYESYNELADSWMSNIRASDRCIPTGTQVRDLTPLVPLPAVLEYINEQTSQQD